MFAQNFDSDKRINENDEVLIKLPDSEKFVIYKPDLTEKMGNISC